MKDKLLQHLETFITPHRSELIDNVLKMRTRYLTVVLEDIYQPHNASAVLRSCDCFGIQDIHIIENRNKYRLNPDITLGSDKWLDIHKHSRNDKNNTLMAINFLKKKGYKIVATTLQTNSISLEEFNLTNQKTAILFGTELNGLSDDAMNNADEFIKIPMFGFTQSFNISVSAGIILYSLTNRLRTSFASWELTIDEKLELKIKWIKQGLRMGEKVEEFFLSRNEK